MQQNKIEETYQKVEDLESQLQRVCDELKSET